MIFLGQFFLITIYFFSSLSASNLLKEENFDFITPSEEIIKTYEEQRNLILSFIPDSHGDYWGICKIKGNLDYFVPPFKILLNGLKHEDLIKIMSNENSNYFLAFFWHYFSDCSKTMRFDQTVSLGPPSYRFFLPKFISLKRIFKNFRIFLSQSFLRSKFSNNQESSDPSSISNLLLVSEIFWNQRLKHIGRRVLRPTVFIKWKRIIEERFALLDMVLSKGIEDLLIQEYGKLVYEIKDGIGEITSPIRNFCFLVRYLGLLLKDVKCNEFLSRLEWLSQQTPMFLAHFFYFLKYYYLDRCFGSRYLAVIGIIRIFP
jgi:hypothetical protein